MKRVQYRDVRTTTGRSLVRHAVLDGLAAWYSVSGRADTALQRNRVEFLYFHHVFPDEEKAFARLIDELAQTHHFVAYSEGVDRILTGAIDKPYATISFDDGISSCLNASRIMDARGVKGCFFVCPPMMEEKDPTRTAEFSARIGMPALEFLDWSDADRMLRSGHEIGAHTMTHANLAQASPQQLTDEIGGSRAAVLARTGHAAHFAWPFGTFSHFSATAARVVFDSGFATCASAERGCHTETVRDNRALCIRRDAIVAGWPLRHVRYFMARSAETSRSHSGLWPPAWSTQIGRK